MSATKPAVKKMLKTKLLRAAQRRQRGAKKAKTMVWTITRVNKAVEKDIKTAAVQAKDDPAFKLFVGSALNGDTLKVTGWPRVDA